MPGARKNPGGTGKGHRSFAATEARAWRPWRLAFGPRQPAAKEAFQKQREEMQILCSASRHTSWQEEQDAKLEKLLDDHPEPERGEESSRDLVARCLVARLCPRCEAALCELVPSLALRADGLWLAFHCHPVP